MGGTSTNIALFKENKICRTSHIPSGGHQITHDISIDFNIPFELAEELKKKHGSLIPSEETINKVIDQNGYSVSYDNLGDVIRARVEELLRLVILEMPRDYAKLIPSGMVITGGCAKLPGIIELAESITRLPVRIGVPQILNRDSFDLLNDPVYSTAIGLILWGMRNDNLNEPNMSVQAMLNLKYLTDYRISKRSRDKSG